MGELYSNTLYMDTDQNELFRLLYIRRYAKYAARLCWISWSNLRDRPWNCRVCGQSKKFKNHSLNHWYFHVIL